MKSLKKSPQNVQALAGIFPGPRYYLPPVEILAEEVASHGSLRQRMSSLNNLISTAKANQKNTWSTSVASWPTPPCLL
jgi:hypothetical protein